jgi:integrase
LATAIADEILDRNPCRVVGAGVERSPERPIATLAEIEALANTVGRRWRAMVLLAAWCGLRFGELIALRRSDVDLLCGAVRVERTVVELTSGKRILGPPKTRAGLRTVAIPPHVLPEIEAHLEAYVGPEPDSLMFAGERGGGFIRRSWWSTHWKAARESVGVDLRFHDLRHTGNTLAASTGPSTRELMARMGHASSSAALRYQHATWDRDQAIARALSDLAAREGPDGVSTLPFS